MTYNLQGWDFEGDESDKVTSALRVACPFAKFSFEV